MVPTVSVSSQFVPIHSPLISSMVDFVCSSDQPSQELILHRLESHTVWTEGGDWQVFPSRRWRLFFRSLWCVVVRVRKSGVFLLLSILLILSIFFTSFRLGLHCVYPSTVHPTFATNWKDQLVLGSSLASNTVKHTWMWPTELIDRCVDWHSNI